MAASLKATRKYNNCIYKSKTFDAQWFGFGYQRGVETNASLSAVYIKEGVEKPTPSFAYFIDFQAFTSTVRNIQHAQNDQQPRGYFVPKILSPASPRPGTM